MSPRLTLLAFTRLPLTLRLYTEGGGETVVDFTEATNYEPAKLDPASWSIEGDTAYHPEVTFPFSAPAGIVAGWYITVDGEDDVFASEAFGDDAPSIHCAGCEVMVTPRLKV